MRFLSVAERELRAAARPKATYRTRWITAAIFFALLVWLLWVFNGFRNRRAAPEVFEVFSILTFGYCLITGTAWTADSYMNNPTTVECPVGAATAGCPVFHSGPSHDHAFAATTVGRPPSRAPWNVTASPTAITRKLWNNSRLVISIASPTTSFAAGR